jgi:glutamyl-Q tRNA(Asp) synthetase
MDAFVTRFAPSPNGYLHLGHAFSALKAHHGARAHATWMLLRIDDIDTSRAREEYVQAIYQDLAWLGVRWEEPVRIQSAHMADYDAAAVQLQKQGMTYPCFCTRKSLLVDTRGHYAGTCRTLSPADIAARRAKGEQAAIRLNTAQALKILPQERLTYIDNGRLCRADSAPLDDPIIVRKDIGSSYLLSCVIDDAAQQVTHVIRGQDIQPLTPLQVILQALLQRPTPTYIHHELIMEDATHKLSKSKGSTSLRELRDQGATPQQIWADLGFAPLPG